MGSGHSPVQLSRPIDQHSRQGTSVGVFWEREKKKKNPTNLEIVSPLHSAVQVRVLLMNIKLW